MEEDGQSPLRVRSRHGAPLPQYRQRMSIGGVTCLMCGTVLSEEGEGTRFGCPTCREPSGGAVTASNATRVTTELRKRFEKLSG